MQNKTRKIILALIILILAAILLVLHFGTQKSDSVTASATLSECGLTVTSPATFAAHTTYTATATVDNRQKDALGCSWTVFEAVAGTVTLLDDHGKELVTKQLATSEDWMTENPVGFSAEMNIPDIATGHYTLAFIEENPSDGPDQSVLLVPVTVTK